MGIECNFVDPNPDDFEKAIDEKQDVSMKNNRIQNLKCFQSKR